MEEKSNREQITEQVLRYMRSLPEPKDLPEMVEIKIMYAAGTERHVIRMEGKGHAV